MTDQDSRLANIERSLPDEIGLCPDPEHTEEFYMPHRGTCPWCANEMAVYVPEQQLRGAVVVTDAGIVRAERWMLNEMHDGLTNRECIDAILNALRGQ